jgi:PncC family amidohydrolase
VRDASDALDELRRRGLRLAVAESFTGGRLLDRLTDVPGSSDVLIGGLVAYDDRLKRRLLGVPASVIRRHGAVSPETAARMARGVRRALGADVGVATTGIAGPSGARPNKPVGTSVVGVSIGRRSAVELLVHQGDRDRVKDQATAQALRLLLASLRRNG